MFQQYLQFISRCYNADMSSIRSRGAPNISALSNHFTPPIHRTHFSYKQNSTPVRSIPIGRELLSWKQPPFTSTPARWDLQILSLSSNALCPLEIFLMQNEINCFGVGSLIFQRHWKGSSTAVILCSIKSGKISGSRSKIWLIGMNYCFCKIAWTFAKKCTAPL